MRTTRSGSPTTPRSASARRVWGTDPDRNRRVADRIDAGMVYLNRAGGSQADLPFGGIKRSGLGRELGPAGIEEFMNKKSIRLG